MAGVLYRDVGKIPVFLGNGPVCTENLNSDIVMMKSAEYRV
jgi:hypothetical protein